jgi:hypothetical protein
VQNCSCEGSSVVLVRGTVRERCTQLPDERARASGLLFVANRLCNDEVGFRRRSCDHQVYADGQLGGHLVRSTFRTS